MNKVIIILLIFFPIFCLAVENNQQTSFADKTKIILAYDLVRQNGKLRNYRNVPASLGNIGQFNNINLQGFAELNISGSAQFSKYELPYILQRARGKVFIVDLRQESHGFINDRAFTWFGYRNQTNINKTPTQIQQEENELLAELARHKTITMHEIKKIGGGAVEAINSVAIIIKKVASEQDIIKQTKANYIRFYILDRHKPDDVQVDEFIKFVRALPPNAWLHFHCRAGKGRTTMFMVMYDILCNAKDVSLKDILARHAYLGGTALDTISRKSRDQWLVAAAADRYQFISNFYHYAVASNGGEVCLWSEWIKKNYHD